MRILSVKLKAAERRIPIYTGSALWERITTTLREEFAGRLFFVVCDSNIAALYGAVVQRHLGPLDTFGGLIEFPAGEHSKSREQLARLEDTLLERGAGRDALILAFGGGVTGDLAGFAAACLHRGLTLIQVPTSLLAQVDSSIGGKVGINHPGGKNLLGAFYQAHSVIIDTDYLRTLPDIEFCNGMAEVIKYAAILDAALFEFLESNVEALRARRPDALLPVVERCAELKARVVERDERENAYRSILNFGHTAGHAIEQAESYNIKHGFAVAAGMRIAARLSNKLLAFAPEDSNRLGALLAAYGLAPAEYGPFALERLWPYMMRDKKAAAGKPRFTLLRAIGEPELLVPVDKETLAGVW